MTHSNKLLAVLDKQFGFKFQQKSSVRKIKQFFDEKRNEHVFIVEYRVVRGTASDRMKQQKEERELHRADQFRVGELLKRINADVVS
ncbi:MAG TPA: hypothetical protein EYO59_08600 [Chromatiaceae bacterium]|nr:hypothetical protein [Chromatiaceae bacterium]HIB84646.1 hypothetical protein [Chromatiaceae bacterium]